LPIWIGGAGEKRTLRTAARFADGWNAPYLSPAEWKRKSEVLDAWCGKVGRDPGSIARTINVGFYMGADATAAKRHVARRPGCDRDVEHSPGGAELGVRLLRAQQAQRQVALIGYPPPDHPLAIGAFGREWMDAKTRSFANSRT